MWVCPFEKTETYLDWLKRASFLKFRSTQSKNSEHFELGQTNKQFKNVGRPSRENWNKSELGRLKLNTFLFVK